MHDAGHLGEGRLRVGQDQRILLAATFLSMGNAPKGLRPARRCVRIGEAAGCVHCIIRLP